MPIPDPRKNRENYPYLEAYTFYSNDNKRTYHVKKIYYPQGGHSYIVSMEVVAKRAAEDIKGSELGELTEENTKKIWDEIWETKYHSPL